jgi:hypothetical protein
MGGRGIGLESSIKGFRTRFKKSAIIEAIAGRIRLENASKSDCFDTLMSAS